MSIIERVRDLLSSASVAAMDGAWPIVIKSPEGIGKTSVLFSKVPDDHFEKAASSDNGSGGFLVFASRSYDQAMQKRDEYVTQTGRQAIVICSFTDRYHRACEAEGVQPLEIFEESELDGDLLNAIRERQPTVWKRLEATRGSYAVCG